jgi:hypothetical protein
MARLIWWPLLVAGLVASCSSSGSGKTAEPTATTSPVPWVHAEPTVHTSLSSTADSFVYGGVVGQDLVIVALDPATGEERWRKPAALGDASTKVGFAIHTDSQAAYFLEAATGGQSTVVAIRTLDGQELWHRDISGLASPAIRACGDALCVMSRVGDGTQLQRLDQTSGVPVGDPVSIGTTLTVVGRSPSAQTLAVGGQPLQVHELAADGTEAWSVPASTVFGSVNVDPSGGYAGISQPDGGWVLWLGADTTGGVPVGGTVSAGAVAGIGPKGEATWLRPDRHFCRLFLSGSQATPADCDGQLRRVSAVPGAVIDLTVTNIQGFDPTNGTTTWTVDLGPGINEADPANAPLRLDDHVYMLQTSQGKTRIDLVAGDTSPAPDDLIAWCRSAPASDTLNGPDGATSYARVTSFAPCHFDGTPASTPAGVPDFAGTQTAGVGAWIEDAAVHAVAVSGG